jgi:hypothetical protein
MCMQCNRVCTTVLNNKRAYGAQKWRRHAVQVWIPAAAATPSIGISPSPLIPSQLLLITSLLLLLLLPPGGLRRR